MIRQFSNKQLCVPKEMVSHVADKNEFDMDCLLLDLKMNKNSQKLRHISYCHVSKYTVLIAYSLHVFLKAFNEIASEILIVLIRHLS